MTTTYTVVSDYPDRSFTTPMPSARMAKIHARAAAREGASVVVLDPQNLLVWSNDA
jgi:hypothetical protein